jgi:hypothetical protein
MLTRARHFGIIRRGKRGSFGQTRSLPWPRQSSELIARAILRESQMVASRGHPSAWLLPAQAVLSSLDIDGLARGTRDERGFFEVIETSP